MSEANPFEKTGGGPQKPAGGRGRLPVGAILAIVLVVVLAAGALLFWLASGTGGAPDGSTTAGTGAVIALLAG